MHSDQLTEQEYGIYFLKSRLQYEKSLGVTAYVIRFTFKNTDPFSHTVSF